MISALSRVLSEVTSINDLQFPFDLNNASPFDCKSLPSITIGEYCARLWQYADCSLECFIMALCYMDTITALHPGLRLTTRNVYKLLLTSLLLAIKFLDDHPCSNSEFALLGGVSKAELNQLELEFLGHMEFSLHVDQQIFERYTNLLSRYADSENTRDNNAADCQQQQQQQQESHKPAQTACAPQCA